MKKKSEEHAILSYTVVDGGRLVYLVQIDDEQESMNFCMGKHNRAQVEGEAYWFSSGEDGSWMKLNHSGNPVANYPRNGSRMNRLLNRIAMRAMADLILGE